MIGQINRGSYLGEAIYNFSKSESIINILEIGTWNGAGSTRCILEGIKDSKIKKNLLSIELYYDQWELANNNTKNYISEFSNFLLLNGSIVSYNDVFWFDHSIILNNPSDHDRLWYDKDLSLLKTSTDVSSYIPESIDLLILDGGEYTTYPEWLKLKNKTKICILDDINTLKCNRIYNEILSDNKNYKILISNEKDRNGYCIFERIK